MRSDKLIQVLEDKSRLQEELKEKNAKIAELEELIKSMKGKKHERRVSFSDIESLGEESVTSVTKTFTSKGQWLKRRISIDGKKIAAKAKSAGSKIIKNPAKAKIVKALVAAKIVKTSVPPGYVSLKTVVESRHRGSWSNLNSKQKASLYDSTSVFLKKYNLPVGEKLQQLQMPEYLQEKFNDYLDYLVDKDIFASPRGKNSSANTFTESMLLDAIRKVDKSGVQSKKISFEESEESDRSTSAAQRPKSASPVRRITVGSKKRSVSQIQDSDKNIVKKPKKPVVAKQKVIKKPSVLKGSTKRARSTKRASSGKKTEAKTKGRSLFSWFSLNSIFSG